MTLLDALHLWPLALVIVAIALVIAYGPRWLQSRRPAWSRVTRGLTQTPWLFAVLLLAPLVIGTWLNFRGMKVEGAVCGGFSLFVAAGLSVHRLLQRKPEPMSYDLVIAAQAAWHGGLGMPWGGSHGGIPHVTIHDGKWFVMQKRQVTGWTFDSRNVTVARVPEQLWSSTALAWELTRAAWERRGIVLGDEAYTHPGFLADWRKAQDALVAWESSK